MVGILWIEIDLKKEKFEVGSGGIGERIRFLKIGELTGWKRDCGNLAENRRNEVETAMDRDSCGSEGFVTGVEQTEKIFRLNKQAIRLNGFLRIFPPNPLSENQQDRD